MTMNTYVNFGQMCRGILRWTCGFRHFWNCATGCQSAAEGGKARFRPSGRATIGPFMTAGRSESRVAVPRTEWRPQAIDAGIIAKKQRGAWDDRPRAAFPSMAMSIATPGLMDQLGIAAALVGHKTSKNANAEPA